MTRCDIGFSELMAKVVSGIERAVAGLAALVFLAALATGAVCGEAARVACLVISEWIPKDNRGARQTMLHRMRMRKTSARMAAALNHTPGKRTPSSTW